jgi:hypothetical protein
LLTSKETTSTAGPEKRRSTSARGSSRMVMATLPVFPAATTASPTKPASAMVSAGPSTKTSQFSASATISMVPSFGSLRACQLATAAATRSFAGSNRGIGGSGRNGRATCLSRSAICFAWARQLSTVSRAPAGNSSSRVNR